MYDPHPLTRTIALVAVALLFLGGCRASDLSFRADQRIEILTPAQRSTVALPFQVRWTASDFVVTGPDGARRTDAGYFVVLLDTTPMPPGESLAYFARDDDRCSDPAVCATPAYLAERNIYLVEGTDLDVTNLSDTRPVDRPSADDRHEITIVLLNGRDERIGEAAFRVEFTVDRGRR